MARYVFTPPLWAICSALTSLIAIRMHAATLDKRVTLQPIIVCNDHGQNCPAVTPQLFEAESDRIWAQAGINIKILEAVTVRSSSFQVVETASEFQDWVAAPGHGQHTNAEVLNMWIVQNVTGAYGRALTGRNGIVIGENVFTYQNGQGRLDTIAHEIGHNLGLGHDIYGAIGSTNLMTPEGRLVPATPCDIYPGDAMADRLNDVQMAIARGSQFVTEIPEPERTALNTSGPIVLVMSASNRLEAIARRCRCYQLQGSTNVAITNGWTDLGHPIFAIATNVSWPFAATDSQGFFRLKSF